MRSVFALGKTSSPPDGGYIGLPYSTEAVPDGDTAAGFYPLSVSPENLFRLQFRAFQLEFESQLLISSSGGNGSATPRMFQRFPTMPGDERMLIYYPGMCNTLNSAFTSDDYDIGGEVQIGWVGGTPFPPVDDSNQPANGVWPPGPADMIRFDPFSLGNPSTTGGLSNTIYHNGRTRPFIWIWLSVAANLGSDLNYFVSNPDLDLDSSIVCEDADLSFRVFGWGSIPMYRLRLSNDEAIRVTTFGGFGLKASRFYTYANADGTGRVWDHESGEQILPTPLDSTFTAPDY